MDRPHVPQFGKWEGKDDVPYTVYFDKARQGRGGRMINPNDPQENPEAFGNGAPPSPPTKPQTEHDELVKHKPTHERRASREDHDVKQAGRAPAPAQFQESEVAGEGNKRSSRTSIGSEQSIDRSPLHPRYQAKVAGRGNGTPSWEGKGSTGHGTPGRSHLKGHDDDMDKGVVVPKFGEWDEANPASADGFTHIFNKAREERHRAPNITTETHDYSELNRNNGHQKTKSCCFPWGK